MGTLKDKVLTYEEFEKLKLTLDKMISFNEDTVEKDIRKFGNLYSNLTNVYINEQLYINELQSELSKAEADVQDSIKSGRVLYDNREEFKIKMRGDATIRELNLEISKRQTFIDYIKEQQSNIKSVRFDISNYIKWKKYLAGDND